jgi:hypothetical protein
VQQAFFFVVLGTSRQEEAGDGQARDRYQHYECEVANQWASPTFQRRPL